MMRNAKLQCGHRKHVKFRHQMMRPPCSWCIGGTKPVHLWKPVKRAIHPRHLRMAVAS